MEIEVLSLCWTEILISSTKNDSASHSVMFNSLQPYGPTKPGFNSMWTVNFQMFQLDLEKEEEPEIKLPTSPGSSKKHGSSRKMSTALLTMPKPLTVWITTNCGKFFKRWEYQTTCKTLYAGQETTLELDMEQHSDSKLGKENVKAV